MSGIEDGRDRIPALEQRIAELENNLVRCTSQLMRVDGRLWGEVSDREAVEESLRLSEATMASLFRVAPIGIGLVENRVLGWVNEEMVRLTGRSREELSGQSARVLYPTDLEYERVGKVKHAAVSRSGVGSVETRWLTKDGKLRDILLGSASLDPESPLKGMVFTALDITEQKEADLALRHSEEKYRSLVRNAVYGIYRSNRAGRFLEVNPALVRMLGYDSREELLTADMAKDVYQNPGERAAIIEAVGDQEVLHGVETHWKRKDGTPIEVRTSGRVIRDLEGHTTGWEMIVEDVTERRVLEAQLRQSQKLEALGTLAGGVAHDFNNLLTAIGGYSEMLRRNIHEGDPLRSRVDGIHEASQRAATLTRQLRARRGGGGPPFRHRHDPGGGG
jgi:two-component system cell cycle sensor histidine kinase/response regulator CckA